MEVKVSSKTNPNSAAGMIANLIYNGTDVCISCIGAGALNQAIKAIAIARGYTAPAGYNLVCIPAFKQIDMDGESRTAIQLIVEPK